jgi:hypothetical protein
VTRNQQLQDYWQWIALLQVEILRTYPPFVAIIHKEECHMTTNAKMLEY